MKQAFSTLVPVSLVTSLLLPTTAFAQITPDGTTSTTVTPTPQGVQINQGDQGGGNLFHSFGQFSVPNGTEAHFNNASDVVNIFSRVTGGDISNINGLIRANGGANLFLINPAGILFGEGARLQLGGSFYGSTADSIIFPDGEFSASDLESPVTLTIKAPIGLNFRDEIGDITNNSQVLDNSTQTPIGIQVQPSKTIGLIGGDIKFNGGILTAPGGNIELGSVSNSSFVNLIETASGFTAEYGEVTNFGSIYLNQQAVVNAGGIGGGRIQVQGKELILRDGSQIISATNSNLSGGTISINTSESVELIGTSSNTQIPSSIQNHTFGFGDGGNLLINTGKLKIAEGALIFSATFAQGNGGNIQITTSEAIEIIGNGFDQYQETFIRGILLGTTLSAEDVNGISVGTFERGKSGSIFIDTPSLYMSNGSSIFSPTFANGAGGNIEINASESVAIIGSALQSGAAFNSTGEAGDITVNGNNVKIGDGGIIVSATLGSGSGGDIKINAGKSLELFNTPITALIPGGILANSSRGIGNAGDIEINTHNLLITDGAVINNNSGAIIPNPTLLDGFLRLSGGVGGNIKIDASNSIKLDGISANGVTSSGIGTTALGLTFPAGNIDIATNSLIVQNGARIDAATIGAGDGGQITIDAINSITISGKSRLGEAALINGFIPSAISATSGRIDIPFEATGKAGDLSVKTGQLIIQDEAEIAISSISLGVAGNLEIISDSVVLKNQGQISAATLFEQGGNISLRVDETISLIDESLISAQAGNNANGGNITIDTDFIIAYPSVNQGNDILASAEQGQGGKIDITAEALFGIEERKAFTNNGTNDIDATSGIDGLDGTVSINTPETNSFRENTELPETVASVEEITASNPCSISDTGEIETNGALVVKGKGGIPPEPTEPFTQELLIDDNQVANSTESPTNQAVSNNQETVNPYSDPTYIPPHIKPVAYKPNGEPIYIARGVIVHEDGSFSLTAFPTPGTPGYREYIEQIGCSY